ncbi:Na+/H+ antiporter family protein [Bacillus massilinigeriensis]|uniref:Na+/H+ antiporter family protein n=1 Tax=Bacillus mediterraneensis TaxID=1805474 RepID=UPI0008F86C8E|nr:Na+/H+ antiporter family protein [Bacillus mediterraneensis]
MNAVIIAVLAMLILSLLRVNVVISLIVASIIGGLTGGLGLQETMEVFTNGLGGSAPVALSYALLGGFAMAVSSTGLPDALVDMMLKVIGRMGEEKGKVYSKILIVSLILLMAIFSQNLIPIHIAFIPIFIPPLLAIFNKLKLDRRLVAAVITFGLITPYMFLPAGFGKIFHEILQKNMANSGLVVKVEDIPQAMLLPAVGMIAGLLIAVIISYRKPRNYTDYEAFKQQSIDFSKRKLLFSVIAIIAALAVQIAFKSMIFGALAGIIVIYFSGAVQWKETDSLLTGGMKMMASIGFVMLAAFGFADVLKETGDVNSLVQISSNLIGNSKPAGAFIMLIVGLLVTLGIGSSFSTIPVIATIFVPLCLQLGFSPMATIAIIGTSAALGDAGSPASDSTLGPTSGLNADGQHNHIWDTCIPTFTHYNIPLILFGWIAAMVL